MTTLYPHQAETVQFVNSRPDGRTFDMSDAGTGKTIAHLAAFNERLQAEPNRRMVVVCLKTLMQLAWGNDILKAFPHLSFSLATAENRAIAFNNKARITIVNTDGIKWVEKNMHALEGVTDLTIDESTSFKNRTSDRSKAAAKVTDRHHFHNISLLSGTPNPLGVLDLWHQMKVLDGGLRLGTSFVQFQSAVCTPKQTGPSPRHVTWVEKPGMNDVVAELLRDVTIRHPDTVLGLPPNRKTTYAVPLNTRHRAMYETFRKEAILQLSDVTISSFHAAALRTKVLQLLSGAVYHSEGEYTVLDQDRYELVMDLIEERRACVVPFMWRHQRDQLIQACTARKMSYGVIDGNVELGDRLKVANDFQAGNLRVLFIHPQSAAHGITLTRGSATIWPSPTDNAEFFLQVNKRIDRIGQEAPTETIMICGENTIEEKVYDHLLYKAGNVTDLLGLFVD